ncbi:AbiTii domain-containing protein [Parageobacillus toebii]|uniref:AbiTii domain-containing protein n=1 Tax=Parageobacillus toebii TaxID=153151 RepID=A0A150MMY9_9BACL|nr:hypothetical protein [Parageobacillus toebii]KYD25834.1 hypothetical protein B4110_3796 [Parageobacillus toebii]
MGSLVRDLQKQAMDSSIPITDLLRNAYVVAKKLKIKEFEKWTNLELNGYKDNNVPDYRIIQGQIKAFNPLYGCWIPVFFDNTKWTKALQIGVITQAISEIVTLINTSDETLQMEIPPEIEKYLLETMEVPLKIAKLISKSQLQKIVDSVRNAVLEWALDLESEGIVGEDMTFTKEEKQLAQSVTYNIQNYIGGSVYGSQIQQGSSHSTQSQTLNVNDIKDIIESLKNCINDLELNEKDKKLIEANIATAELQLSSPEFNKTILRECFKTIRNVLEGITASHIAAKIGEKIDSILNQLF